MATTVQRMKKRVSTYSNQLYLPQNSWLNSQMLIYTSGFAKTVFWAFDPEVLGGAVQSCFVCNLRLQGDAIPKPFMSWHINLYTLTETTTPTAMILRWSRVPCLTDVRFARLGRLGPARSGSQRLGRAHRCPALLVSDDACTW